MGWVKWLQLEGEGLTLAGLKMPGGVWWDGWKEKLLSAKKNWIKPTEEATLYTDFLTLTMEDEEKMIK